MKLIVVIVASNSEIYNQFKTIIINYIIKLNNSNLSFYFLYSDTNVAETEQKLIYNNYNQNLLFTDFYDKDISGEEDRIKYISKSMFKRTVTFFNYLKINNLLDQDTFVLRTNLTTFFDFNKLFKWLEDKPHNLFFSGSFNGEFLGINTTVSGTNMIMSSDIVDYLSNFKYDLKELDVFSEDETLSLLIIRNLPINVINIKRLDIIEIDPIPELNIPYIQPTVVYHKCPIRDESIFSFRFKTHNRIRDINCMNTLSIDIFDPNFNIEQYVLKLIKLFNFDLNVESPEYSYLYSQKVFTLLVKN